MNGIYEEVRIALHGIWQRRWLALAIAWIVCLLGWAAVALVPNSYESKARIFVQIDNVLADQIGISQGDRRRDIDRVRQTLTSSVNLEKVIRGTRLGDTITNDKQMESAVQGLAKQIKVVSQQDNLFEITATAGYGQFGDVQNAKLAQDIVQKMIDIFREENLSGGRGEMNSTLSFMDQQLADRQKDLEAAEQKREAFEAKNSDLLPGTGSLSARLETSRSQLTEVEANLVAAQSALASINGQIAGTPQTIVTPGAQGGPAGALAQAQSQLLADKARGLTDDHPDVVALKAQIGSLKKQVAAEGNRTYGTPNPAYTSLQSIKADREASVAALSARKQTLQQDIASMEAKQYSEPAVAAEAARINRDYSVLKDQYDKLLRDREALRLRGQVENERDAVKFDVIDPPTTPRTPVAPDRPLLLALVLVIGLGAGGGAAFALGQARSTFATTGQLERATGLQVLGQVSESLTRAARAQRVKHLKWFAGGTAGLAGVFVLLLALEFMKRGMVA
ncbi:GNVR domain-containing protein [Novosphingobium sp. ZN18A2]|uniref:XrtA system polysaccharide chain length determinant n=1 Tax=Novosphingobium sp. ZN18A2 TaxID=3079861 RepID=UPI0030D5294A